MKTYLIGEKTYAQDEIVLGQYQAINEIIKDVEFPAEAGATDVIAAFGSNIHSALAVVLIEQGCGIEESIEDRENFQARAKYLQYHIKAAQVLEVVGDFFEVNPVSTVRAELIGMAGRVRGAIAGQE